MADGFVNYLASLQKGETVQLVCKGSGMLVGSAMLSECEPVNIFAEDHVSAWAANIADQFLKGNKDVNYLLLCLIAASKLADSSTCFRFGTDREKCSKCTAEIISIANEKRIDKFDLKVAADKLKLDIDKIKEKTI